MGTERLFEVSRSSPITSKRTVNVRVLTPQTSFVHDATRTNTRLGSTLNQMDPRQPQGETVTRNNYSTNLHADFEVTFTRTTAYGCILFLYFDGQTNHSPAYYILMRIFRMHVNLDYSQGLGKKFRWVEFPRCTNCTVYVWERSYRGERDEGELVNLTLELGLIKMNIPCGNFHEVSRSRNFVDL